MADDTKTKSNSDEEQQLPAKPSSPITANDDESTDSTQATEDAEMSSEENPSAGEASPNRTDDDAAAAEGTDGCDDDWVKPELHDEPQHMRKRDGSISIAVPIALVLAIITVLLVRSYIVEPYIIPSESMDPTIEVGDMVLGEKISLKTEAPKQGDIVFFKNPDSNSSHGVLVKRVVAVGGQTVDLRNGKVYIDGEEEKNEHVHGMSMPLAQEYLETDVAFPYTVPDGCIWVMGDNRENSLDSRSFGAIPVDTVYAESWIRYWPFNRIGTVD